MAYNRLIPPPFFEAPFGVNPLEFCDEIWRQKTRVLELYHMVKKSRR